MVKLLWLKSAQSDLKNIYDYIAIDSKRYAKYQVNQIRQKTEILKDHPNIGKIVPEYNHESIREIVSGHYRIIYRIVDNEWIHILLIHHGARKFPRISKD